jgi:hypothetical protein
VTMEQPDILLTYPHQRVPDHVVVLSFSDDSDAIDFSGWWNTIGYKIFEHYVERDS